MHPARLTPRVALSLLLLGVPVAARAQAPTQQQAPTMLEMLRFGFGEVTGNVLRAAEMVPEDQYGYRPVATVRTLGQLVGHIADGNNYYCGRASGANTPWVETVALSNATKAELIAQLRVSIAACTAAHTPNAARVDQLLANLSHVSHHYGNIVTYLRMLGLTPPPS